MARIFVNRYRTAAGVGLEEVRRKIGWVNDAPLGGYPAGHSALLAYVVDRDGTWVEVGVCDEPIANEGWRVRAEFTSLIEPSELTRE